jgi:hypothetical protein
LRTLFDQDQTPTGTKCSTHFASVSAGKAAIRSSTAPGHSKAVVRGEATEGLDA